MRPNQFQPHWQTVQTSDIDAEEVALASAEEVSDNPFDFFQELLGVKPYLYQEEFIKLFVENQFLAARWNRQSGKNFIVAALLLWYAVTH
jgi:hypothetical protein